MLRGGIKAAIIVALGAGFARGVLALFTDLEWSALTANEQNVVLAVIGLPLLVIAAIVLVRAWRMRARAAYFADLGFAADEGGVHRKAGGWIAAHAGKFEAPDGTRRDVWLVHAAAANPGKALVIQPKDAPVTDYMRELAPVAIAGLPESLGAWANAASADFLDDAAVAELAAVGELVQLRVTAAVVRILLERRTPPANVRRTVLLGARIAGIRLPKPAAEPPAPPADAFDRRVPSYKLAGIAAIAYFAAVIGVGALAPDHEGYEDFIMARVRACDLARDTLGEPIKRTQFGWQPSTASGRKHSSHMLVEGPRGKGDIEIHAWVRTRGTDPRAYPIIDAVMEAPGGAIEVYACSRSWKTGITAPRAWQARERGGANRTCTVRVEPAPKPGYQECRLEVECGGHRIYGATPELGYADCWTVRDRGRDDIVVSDPDRGLERPEPIVELDERTGVAKLGTKLVLELVHD